jgi:hypothetical protein
MKKIAFLLIMLLLGVSSAFAQAYTLKITWGTIYCNCLGTDADNYYKITFEIIDVANGNTPVYSTTTVNTPDAINNYYDISVPDVETYCGQLHENTPYFLVTVTVQLMETSTGEGCCAGRLEKNGNCQDFADLGGFDVPIGQLN